MKAIKVDLSAQLKDIEIMLIADWHWSDPNSNHEKILEDLEYIRTHDNCYCILNGDIMDCAISSSVGDTYGATLSPMEELRECVSLFKPLAEKCKILCILEGNHERRHYKTNGLNLTQLMAQQLGIEDRYSPTTALIFLRFGQLGSHGHSRKVLYTIYCSHGNGGGRKEGGKINRLADMTRICDADIYIHSHTHLPAIFMDSYYRPSSARSTISSHNRLFVNTGANLDYGGYAAANLLLPKATGDPQCLVLEFTPTNCHNGHIRVAW